MTLAAPNTLGHTRELITPMLHAIVDRLDPPTRLVVSYHLGWCDATGAPATVNGGKAIRPGLALLGAEAAGAEQETALPGAVAVELVHNFSLVHDDLMDRDLTRRHRPTVWALWGDAVAVLAGDAMLSLAHEVLLDCGSPRAVAAQRVIAVATRELIRGQAADTAFANRSDVTLGECVDMAQGKTAALMSASAAIGAVLAGAPESVTDVLACYGAHLGMGFQLVDDLLGIWGRPEVTGKPVYSDLRSRKKTLPVTWTIENGGRAGRRLAAWLADAERAEAAGNDELAAVAQLIENGGGRGWTLEEARRQAALAADAVMQTGAAEGPASQLRALARYLVGREA
jgi:geranylgeranyl diphosphate synthase, type I